MFDYFLCHETKKWMPWTDKVPSFELDPEVPLQVFFLCLITVLLMRVLIVFCVGSLT